jgi:hypothetical protein
MLKAGGDVNLGLTLGCNGLSHVLTLENIGFSAV